MEFLQKHYEKILLSVVLVGLAVAAAWLPIKVASVRKTLQGLTIQINTLKPKPLPALDLSTNQAALQRVKSPGKLDLDRAGHNVFNPIPWKKKADGTPVPMLDAGLNALTVTNIIPLKLKIKYEGLRDQGDTPRYEFTVTREAATNSGGTYPVPRIVPLGGKNETFILKDIRGPKENPDEANVDLIGDLKTNVWIARSNTFEVVAGYAADLYFEPERKPYHKERVGHKLTLAGTSYNIVAISQSDVTLEDSQTKKRTTLRWNSAP